MKTEYTRDQITDFIKNLDVRASKFTDVQLDNVINRGYAELTTVSKRIFSNEDVVSLDGYYSAGETKITLDVEDDATEIYDLYVTFEGDDKKIAHEVLQDVGIYRNDNVAYRDNRYIGRVHVDLEAIDEVFDNLVVKYYYTPKAADTSVYMDTQTYLAWTDAMWAAANYFLKDIEGETQKRASMGRTSKSISQDPEDIPDRARTIFGGLGL